MKIRFIWEFARFYGITALRRATIYSIAIMALPLTLLFVFYIISKGALLPYAIAGGMIAIVAGNALTIASDAAFFRLELRMQDLLVATQIGQTEYMLGMALGDLIFSLPGIAVYLVLGFAFHIFTAYSLALTAVILLFLALSTAALAFTLSSFVAHVRNVWGITTILSIGLTTLPPIFYPYTLLPNYVLWIFAISPATLAAMLAQGAYGLSPVSVNAAIALVAETVLLFAASLKFARWREL